MSEPIRVLLVDDEESFRTPLTARLATKGFQIEEAASGPEALAKARSCSGNYDVAVIDQVMGPPNGIELMRRLHQSFPNVQVIILTGWGDMSPGETAMKQGAYRYMSKPISNIDELALNIRMAADLNRERQHGLILQALVRTGQRISLVQSESELYQRLYEETKDLLPGLDSFLIARYDEQNHMLSFSDCYVRGEHVTLPPRRNGNGVIEYALRQRGPLLLADGDRAFRDEHGLEPPDPNLGYCASEMVVPMFLEGGVSGAINVVAHRTDIRYTHEHLEVLQALANQAAGAIQNIQQLETARQLLKAATALAGQQGKAAVVRAIVTEAHKLIGHDYTCLVLQEKDGSLRRASPVMPEEYWDLFEGPRQQEGISRLVMDKRELLIIPDTSQDARIKDSLRNAGVHSILAAPLVYEDRALGVLYTHTFEPWHFSPHEVNLWRVFAVQAAAALHSASEEERELERLNQRLRAIVGIFRAYRERRNAASILKRISEAAQETLGSDVVCSLLEYDVEKKEFSERAAAGLMDPDASYTMPQEFKSAFMDKPGPTVVYDVPHHELLGTSTFRQREGINSVVIYPLRIEGEPLGLLFANYRDYKEPTSDEVESIGLFADLSAMVMYETRLQEKLSRTERKLQRRMILDRVSMVETLYRHSQAAQAAAIRNYVAVLQESLAKSVVVPPKVGNAAEILAEIDRLAAKIATVPPRAAQSWEKEAEQVPLAALLKEVAERESRPSPLRVGPRVQIEAEVAALGGIQVRSSRHRLIYVLEALLDNARNAMPQGGRIVLTGRRDGKWAEIRVQDSGMGVPEAVQRIMFKEAIAKEKDEKGMGIGALLVAMIVEEYEGSVELESSEPGNTTVLVRLPITEEAKLEDTSDLCVGGGSVLAQGYSRDRQ